MRSIFHDTPWARNDIGPVGNLPAIDDFGGAHLCSAFAAQDFDPQGAGTKGNIKIGTYRTTADTLATVEVAGYFSDQNVSTTMVTGDLLVVNASDGIRTYELTVTLSTDTVSIVAVPGGGRVVTADSDVTLPNDGHVLLPSTAASALALPAPVAGNTLSLIKTGGSTTITTVVPASSLVFIGNASNRELSFDAIEEAVILKGQSATRWDIISNVGSVAVGTT